MLKKLLLVLTVAAFACIGAVRAAPEPGGMSVFGLGGGSVGLDPV